MTKAPASTLLHVASKHLRHHVRRGACVQGSTPSTQAESDGRSSRVRARGRGGREGHSIQSRVALPRRFRPVLQQCRAFRRALNS